MLVTIIKHNFKNGVKNARAMGGQFDGPTKTWSIDDNKLFAKQILAGERKPGWFGWELAQARSNGCCPHCGTYCYGDCQGDA